MPSVRLRGRDEDLPAERTTALLEAIIAPGDRVTIGGDNQTEADLPAAALANVDPVRVHDLHMVRSVLALPASVQARAARLLAL